MRLSVSKIKAFKACRRLYQLHYIEGLTPVQKAEPLEVGTNYHALIAKLYTDGKLEDVEPCKELAMARAYEKYIFPKVKIIAAEKWIEYDLGNGDTLVGILDGIADDGYIVEHKTCGASITEQYEYKLQWDEQLLAYMMMTGKRHAWYTVCQKPTIRQKKNETDEEFFERMIAWYDEDTDSKIRLLEIERTDDEVENFMINVLCMADTMKKAENSGDFYINTQHCDKWGRMCEFASVCLHYDPNQQYVDFIKEDKNEVEKN